MKNYISINGNKTELTEEQLKQLGINIPPSTPFEKVEEGKTYFYTGIYGKIHSGTNGEQNSLYEIANYFNDEKFAKQFTLHEMLNRLLWRFSYVNGWTDNEWENANRCTFSYSANNNKYCFYYGEAKPLNAVYFVSETIAKRAIDEIVKPFVETHLDFIW